MILFYIMLSHTITTDPAEVRQQSLITEVYPLVFLSTKMTLMIKVDSCMLMTVHPGQMVYTISCTHENKYELKLCAILLLHAF